MKSAFISMVLISVFTLTLPKSVAATENQTINISIEVPKIEASPYHKPYVAVWLESKKRRPIHTFAFWSEQSEWFKDLRQWWRKIGRKQSPNYDATSGATRKPDTYQLQWQTQSANEEIKAGQYVLHFEAVREQGSREYLKQSITLGIGENQVYQLDGQSELGQITIKIN